ncbi:MAG: chromosome partitioning protein [Planctomycetota bacterium]|jgi:chromosome partitioning protein
MRRIALINQKGGVGKTTTAVNLSAALALQGWRVVLVDLDPQANASMHLGVAVDSDADSTYSVLCGNSSVAESLLPTNTLGLQLLPSNIDLSGAELELANAMGRETLLRDAFESWENEHRQLEGKSPADFVIYDCPPSLGLLAINGLAAAEEVFIALQTEFFALQGMGKLVEVVDLMRRRINPELSITGIIACLYDSRLRLAREVLAEIRKYFPGQVFRRTIATNVKLAEAPSYGQTIFEYARESVGARDYRQLGHEVLGQTQVGYHKTEDEAEIESETAQPEVASTANEDAQVLTPQRPPGTPTNIVRADDIPAPSQEVFGRPRFES